MISKLEQINDDEVLVGDPALDIVKKQKHSFDENLADNIDANELNRSAHH